MKSPAPKIRRRVIKDEGPDPIDIFVGKRLRERRLEQHLSQGAVAARLGLTFQAFQKYEVGSSRIAASTLLRLSQILEVAPGYFFEGCPTESDSVGSATRKKGKR